MARKRMIDPTIWEDEEFGSLSMTAKILFIGLFSNADDEGRIRANSAYLKSTIFMYDNIGLKAIEETLLEVSQKLSTVKVYKVNGKQYVSLTNWCEYQKQHKDRIQISTLPVYVGQMTDNVGQMTDNVGVDKVSIDKVSIDKIRRGEERLGEERGTHSLTENDLEVIAQDYHVPLPFVKSKYDDLLNYCASKGKSYKDYKATLRNWVKADAFKIKQDQYGKSKISVIS